MAHKYNRILLSYKRKKIMPFAATWMDPEIVIQNEINQKENNKYHVISLTHRI